MNIEFNPHKTISGFAEIRLAKVTLEVDSEGNLVGIRTPARDWDTCLNDKGELVLDGLNPNTELIKQHDSLNTKAGS